MFCNRNNIFHVYISSVLFGNFNLIYVIKVEYQAVQCTHFICKACFIDLYILHKWCLCKHIYQNFTFTSKWGNDVALSLTNLVP